MRREDLEALREATRARLDAQTAALRTPLMEEARLKAARDAILGQSVAAEGRDLRHRIGADVAWARWSEARLRDLNLHLARNRAVILHRVEELKRAHGRDEAAKRLLSIEMQRERRDLARKAERALGEHLLVRAAREIRVKDPDARYP